MANESAAVLRRLAEAADGFRTGEPIWFVLDPANLAEAIARPTEEAAQAYVAEHPGWTIHGPFITPAEATRSRYIVNVRLDFSDLTYVDLGADLDALFLTTAAREKFAYPYYARVLGAPDAALMQSTDMATSPDATKHSGDTIYSSVP